MKILCLHGRRQSGVTLAKKLFDSSVCQLEKSKGKRDLIVKCGGHEFIFIDGPHVAKADLPKLARARHVACDMYSWWSDEEDDGTKAIGAIHEAKETHGDIEGLLGFSQGGALAASFCRSSSSWQPKFSVFLSAYYFDGFPLPTLLKPTQDDLPSGNIRSIHVWGEKDQVVIPAKSRKLCDWMKGESITIHGGHAAPSPPWTSEVLMKWLVDTPTASSRNVV